MMLLFILRGLITSIHWRLVHIALGRLHLSLGDGAYNTREITYISFLRDVLRGL